MAVEAPRIANPRKFLVVGDGSREDAIARRILKDVPGADVFVAPGNAGTQEIATNIDKAPTDINGLVNFVKDKKIQFVAVGPERPLAMGLADAIEEAGIQVFGHTQDRMFLEASKAGAVREMMDWGIPIPDSEIFTSAEEAEQFIINTSWGEIVVKADGLTEGKGVKVTKTKEEASETVRRFIIEGQYGDAGRTVVLQRRVYGIEASVICFMSNQIGLLVPARDYKPLRDGDEGPNTGGIGVYAPNEIITSGLLEEITQRMFLPTQKGMIKKGKPIKGPVFFGTMITPDGPVLLEYNLRLGDPETGPQLELAEFNFPKAMQDTRNGTLNAEDIVSSGDSVVGVYLISEGYPEKPVVGRQIHGLENAGGEGITILHGRTKREGNRIVTAGGRNILVMARRTNKPLARTAAYKAADRIYFEGVGSRRDIAAELTR